jgi:hypothetical protein
MFLRTVDRSAGVMRPARVQVNEVHPKHGNAGPTGRRWKSLATGPCHRDKRGCLACGSGHTTCGPLHTT